MLSLVQLDILILRAGAIIEAQSIFNGAIVVKRVGRGIGLVSITFHDCMEMAGWTITMVLSLITKIPEGGIDTYFQSCASEVTAPHG